MIDIETLGTRPNAPITTIGAVFFDLQTGEVGKTYYAKIDMVDAMRYGSADAETIRWWLTQSDAARKELVTGSYSLIDALKGLSAFYSQGYDAAVWGNGPTFDITILEYAYGKALGEKAPWPFWNVRDVRTVVQLASGLVQKPGAFTKGGVAHNAVDDCVFQIGYVSKMYRALRGLDDVGAATRAAEPVTKSSPEKTDLDDFLGL